MFPTKIIIRERTTAVFEEMNINCYIRIDMHV